MANCPFCNNPLSDDWLKRRAASLMGKAGGAAKARATARQAANARWTRVRERAKKMAGQGLAMPLSNIPDDH
jgi:hypothetical protein